MDRRLLGKLRGQGRGRIGTRQLEIAGAVAAWFRLNIHPTPRQFGEGIRQQGFIAKIKIEQNLSRQSTHLAALQIELTDERLHHFAELSTAALSENSCDYRGPCPDE